MIEDFTILTKGGVVLWKKQFQQLKSNAINTLIKTVLLEDRGGSNSWSDGDYTLRWTFANELDLIFVVVLHNFVTQLLYIEELLEMEEHLNSTLKFLSP
mmetsp:Transcript_34970/g.58527  ORF Transcript_34970/g.58527 Transcript_34970/m.58527 type:complete len:99 (+) Transcript_34970:192-488(+)|eukprot:CAMPEP_0184646004 /NCGR_PEP_ID=MMETSP0308-20130426/2648_1 /TAXON_ID=38269 /ORGANISM="Gloeochaete witrockiana, Strain SAG 46.84" /LENGTH=98 /DNA_ID=CAMNT_0027075623 /DNA_START=208 /DNA_END=504 /DNA_ORIENTATION=+